MGMDLWFMNQLDWFIFTIYSYPTYLADITISSIGNIYTTIIDFVFNNPLLNHIMGILKQIQPAIILMTLSLGFIIYAINFEHEKIKQTFKQIFKATLVLIAFTPCLQIATNLTSIIINGIPDLVTGNNANNLMNLGTISITENPEWDSCAIESKRSYDKTFNYAITNQEKPQTFNHSVNDDTRWIVGEWWFDMGVAGWQRSKQSSVDALKGYPSNANSDTIMTVNDTMAPNSSIVEARYKYTACANTFNTDVGVGTSFTKKWQMNHFIGIAIMIGTVLSAIFLLGRAFSFIYEFFYALVFTPVTQALNIGVGTYQYWKNNLDALRDVFVGMGVQAFVATTIVCLFGLIIINVPNWSEIWFAHLDNNFDKGALKLIIYLAVIFSFAMQVLKGPESVKKITNTDTGFENDMMANFVAAGVGGMAAKGTGKLLGKGKNIAKKVVSPITDTFKTGSGITRDHIRNKIDQSGDVISSKVDDWNKNNVSVEDYNKAKVDARNRYENMTEYDKAQIGGFNKKGVVNSFEELSPSTQDGLAKDEYTGEAIKKERERDIKYRKDQYKKGFAKVKNDGLSRRENLKRSSEGWKGGIDDQRRR